MATTSRRKLLAGIAAVVFVALIIPWNCPVAHAQTSSAFSPADKFVIPALNGSVSFAVNGSYSTATFENNTWTFTDLQLNFSRLLRNFSISTRDSNITIFSYQTNSVSVLARTLQFTYRVVGQGQQTINLGLSPGQTVQSNSADWYVNYNSTFLVEGQGWRFLPDGSLVINSATGRVTINYDSESLVHSNLPFWQQHSVAIATVTALAFVVVVVVVIKVKSRKNLDVEDGGKEA
jgi:hypothetical protein